MKGLVTGLLMATLVASLGLSRAADAQVSTETQNLFEAAAVVTTLGQPPQVRATSSPCVAFYYPDVTTIDPDTGEEVIYPGWWDMCHWQVFCQSYRVDDVGLDPVMAEFQAAGPVPIFDEFENEVIILTFCREGGRILGQADLGGPLGAFADRSWVYVPIADEVSDIPGTLQDLWAAIPEPDIKIDGAPPVREQTWVQAATWVWIEEIETPLIAVSVNPADTAALFVRAKIDLIEWDFGDGTDLAVCEADRLVVWEEGMAMFDDAESACTHIYKKVSIGGFTMVADVTFVGEQTLISRASASSPWPAPAWVPFDAERQVPGDLVVPVYEIASRN